MSRNDSNQAGKDASAFASFPVASDGGT